MDTEIIVVGAGPSGVCTGIRLKRAGFDDFLVLERAGAVGGTWRDHRYPGLTVDIPSLTYSFSFEQRPDWSSLWAPRDEVLDYFEHCATKYGITEHVRFGSDVVAATYKAEHSLWEVSLADGTMLSARYLINASGYLSVARLPDIPGIDTFEGEMLHTSQWSPEIDLAGKRVAFIGTGATGIQLAPQLAKTAGRIHVFQRTPIWLLPKPPMRVPGMLKRAFKYVPGLQRVSRLATAAFMDLVFYRVFINYPRMGWFGRLAERIGKRHIRRNVDDPKIAEKLTPSYSWGCKRPSFSNDFYPMFNQENVELVTAGIDHIEPDAVVLRDGTRREVDALICATGFQPFERDTLPTYPVGGRDGLELRQLWDERRYEAYQGFAIHGFPNFFMVFGPYSIASSSYIAMIENSTRNIVRCLEAARSEQADYVEVTDAAQRAESERIRALQGTSIWNTASCATSNTYYVDRHGDTPTFRPVTHPVAWKESRNLPVARDFELRRAGHGVPASNTAPFAGAPN